MFVNLVKTPDRTHAGRLQYLYLSLGNICNATCAYCDVHDSPPPVRPYGEPEIRHLLDDAKRLGCTTVHFLGGGEPLVAPTFEVALAACGEFGLRVVVTTNGSHLSRRLVPRLDRVHIEAVLVSLDSHIPAVHDGIRGVRNLWELAVEGIRGCRAAGSAPKIILNHVLTGDNIGQLTAFVAFAGSIGADAVNLIAVKDRSLLQASRVQRQQLARGLPQLREFAATLDVEILCLDQDVMVWAAPQGHRPEREYLCMFPRFAVYADLATGAVFPCDCTVHRTPRASFELGDLWTQSLDEIWHGEPIQRLRQVLETPCDPGCKRDCDWNNMRTNEQLVGLPRVSGPVS